MKLADFFVNIGVTGDVNKLKEVDKTIKKMEESTKRQKEIVKYRKDLAKATTDEEKAQVKKNFADKVKIDNLKKHKEGLIANRNALMGVVKGITAVAGAAALAYHVIDRMAQSLARSNQQMITFQRTTGISFSSLNKYAAANAAVNYNSSIEGTAQSMQRVAQNLWDIRMGRGDISPYQELAYVGGRAFNPMGMSVEQVIESVREAIKGVDDLQATNIITRMGFAPDDLMMLRMSREEFEKINGLFLSPEQREAMNRYALQMKQIDLEAAKLKDLFTLDMMRALIGIKTVLTNVFKGIYAIIIKPLVAGCTAIVKGIDSIDKGLTRLFTTTNDIAKPFEWLYKLLRELYVVFQDFAYAIMGKDSVLGDFFDSIINFTHDLDEAFANSRIGRFFDRIENGVANLNSFFGGKIDTSTYLPNGPIAPDYTPATSSTFDSVNSTFNNDYKFDIHTNMAMDRVISDLVGPIDFSQLQFSYGIKQ